MNTLSLIEQSCLTHNKPASAICLSFTCKQCDILCDDCLNLPGSCKEKGCQIDSLSGTLSNLLKHGDTQIDTNTIQKTVEEVSKMDLKQFQNTGTSFLNGKIREIEELFDGFSDNIGKIFEGFNNEVEHSCSALEKSLAQMPDHIETLSLINLPGNLEAESFKNQLKSKGESLKFISNQITTAKYYLNNEKLNGVVNSIEDIIFINGVTTGTAKKASKKDHMTVFTEQRDKDLEVFKASLKKPFLASNIVNSGNTYFEKELTDLTLKKTLDEPCQKNYTIDALFAVFKPNGNNNNYLYYPSKNDIQVYNLSAEAYESALKGHSQYVFMVRHKFLSEISTDYLVSSGYDKDVIVWNITSGGKIEHRIKTDHTSNYLYTSILFRSLKLGDLAIASSSTNDLVKIWKLNNEKTSSMGKKNDYVYYLQDFTTLDEKKQYMAVATSQDVKIYNLEDSSLYKTFKSSSTAWHMSLQIYSKDKNQYMIATNGAGMIKEWNIHTGEVVHEITIQSLNLRGFLFWTKNQLVVASSDKSVKLVDYKEKKVKKGVIAHNNVVCSVAKVSDQTQGDILITASIDAKIKIWAAKYD